MVFLTKEIDSSGKVVNSKYEASSKQEVINMINNKGHTPLQIEEQKVSNFNNKNLMGNIFKEKILTKDLSVFCKQMGVMLYAGMPLIASLDVLANQSEKAIVREITLEMMGDIQKGESLSQAMKKQKNVFPAMLINMIESGELTGKIDDVFAKMSDYYKKEDSTFNKVKSAMMYPMVLGIMTVIVTGLMIVKIFPTFIGLFESAGAELPGLTKFILNISEILQTKWFIILGVMFAVVFVFKKWKSTKSGKKIWDTFILKVPVVSSQLKKIYTARFTRTLATLIESGISIIDAVVNAAKVTQNEFLIEKIELAVEGIKKGNKLSTELSKVKIFPPMMISMISIGEESGSIEEMLEKSADFYDEELEAALSKLMGLIEPVMIVIMALVIGTIVASMFLPMFDMISVVG